ncbi:hypothetical protein FRC03_004996 [Tulasnella sp. 419]|nr:hypothetical protein FRC03_004996 [Tulasnella sp. 419]
MGALSTPQDLADEFKRSGQLDKIYQRLSTAFSDSIAKRELLERIEQACRVRLEQDSNPPTKSRDVLKSELVEEVGSLSLLEKTLSDVSAELLDDAFMDEINKTLLWLLHKSKEEEKSERK